MKNEAPQKRQKAQCRRKGLESSEVRAQLIDAADRILQNEGSSALTARKIADQVGLSRQIVHYYFGTIEELVVALMQRDAERTREQYVKALACDDPLSVIRLQGINASTKFVEITLLASRYEAVRAELAKNILEIRRIQTESTTRFLEQRGIKTTIPPVVTHSVIQIVSQIIALEGSLGINEGHDAINQFLDRWVIQFNQTGMLPDS